MSTPFLEHIDVFLPGHDDTLTQAPAYHWERTEERSEISAKEGLDEQPSAPPSDQPQNTSGSLLHTAGLSANLYTNTRDPSTVLVAVIGSDSKQKRQLAQSTFLFDHTNLKYHDFDGFGVHLPGILVTSNGTAIAVCQRRHGSMGDGGHSNDILVSRSTDDGKTWSRQQVIYAEPNQYTFLGAIVEDQVSGTIMVACWNMPAEIVDDLGYFSTYAEQGGGFWLVQSSDEGSTWSPARHIVPQPNSAGWIGWPNNSVHGIQLKTKAHHGRIVIPGFLYKEGEPGQVPGVRGGLLYSDDHGETWTVGGVLPEGSDEVALVETAHGEIYVSYRRNTQRTTGRTYARSRDGGSSFYDLGEHADLSGRPVHVGLARHIGRNPQDPDLLLFSHCIGRNRLIPGGTDMTIYASADDGESWSTSKLVDPRPCRYSDLAVTRNGTILCIYTVGEIRDSEKISVARFNVEWMLA